jgi:molybdopterin-containing oxidoreductase family iron-sulfur binding subunit
MIYQTRYTEQKERVFHVLEDIHTLPNINYLSKIRNSSEVMSAHTDEAAGHATAAHKEHA